MANKFSKDQLQGIILLIAALLIFAPIPLIPGQTIGGLAVIGVGLWNLFK